MPGEDWLVIQVDHHRRVPEHFLEVLDDSADLDTRERDAGIRHGHPILVSPSLEIDDRLVRFFAWSPVSAQSRQTKRQTAMALKSWLDWLTHYNIDWTEAEGKDYWDYRSWRTSAEFHPDGGAIEEATFAGSHHSALTNLYDWAVTARLVQFSPIPTRVSRSRSGAAGSMVRGRSAERRDRWVTPDTFQMWRDVGLAGCVARREGTAVRAGDFDDSWKGGRNRDRDTAYVNFMVTTALRRAEQSTLLTVEVPEASSNVRLSSSTAKFGRSRVYTPLPSALGDIARYVDGERARAVLRAKKAGRYDKVQRDQSLLVVTWERKGRKLLWKSEDGRTGTLDMLDADQRRRLYTRDDVGRLEPAMVWLQDSGVPMTDSAQEKVFRRANERVGSLLTALGLDHGSIPELSQHSLRFTFALWLLLALHRRVDDRAASKPGYYDERRYETAFDVVRDMLGHASVTTTKDIYLEPVKGLWRGRLIGDDLVTGDLSDVIGRMTAGADRVLDARTVWEEGEGG